MQFVGEIGTGDLRVKLNELSKQLANSEHFIIRDNWYFIRYGVKLLIFNKVSSQRWKCYYNQLKDK